MSEALVLDLRERTDVGRKLRSEPVFDYLNRSAEKPAACVRDQIETWYTLFPEDGKADVRGRLRSAEASSFDSAFHELCLHAVLTELDVTAELHPTLVVSTKNPGFLVYGTNPATSIWRLSRR